MSHHKALLHDLRKPPRPRQVSNIKLEAILLLFILLSNTAIVANWYFRRPEEVAYISTDGIDIPVRKWALNGHLDKMILRGDGQVEFHGWAFDARNSRLPDTILIYYKGKNIYSAQTHVNRKGVARDYGDKALTSGFIFALPFALFKENRIDNSKLRFFALSNGVASELKYPRGFK